MQARDANGRFIKGNTTEKAQPMTDTTETTRNYIVPVPAFILWPVHVVAWLVATVVRAVALVLLVLALAAIYDLWKGEAESCPAAYQPAISA